MRQRIGIGFASLAVAMFGVALIVALNESPEDTPSDQSSLTANEPEATGLFDDLQIDEAAPSAQPETPAPVSRPSSRRSTGSTNRPAPVPQAPVETDDDDGTVPADYYTNSCGGNGSDGSAGGGGGGCGGGHSAPATQGGNSSDSSGDFDDEESNIDAGGGGDGGSGGDS